MWQHLMHVSGVKLIFKEKVGFNIKINKELGFYSGKGSTYGGGEET